MRRSKMGKKNKVAAFLLIAILFLSNSSPVMAIEILPETNSEFIILVDPGHGGIDGGAVGRDATLEKNVNLMIGKKLKDTLVKEGYHVLMTREEDKGLYTDNGRIRKKKLEDLNNRQKMIKDSQCQIFLSIHLNMFPQQQYHGAQVWYAANEKSRKFGLMAQENLRKDLNNENKREAKAAKDSYIILRNPPDIAAIIVECGFMSNAEEAAKLKNSDYQEKIAQSLLKTVKQYTEENRQSVN